MSRLNNLMTAVDLKLILNSFFKHQSPTSPIYNLISSLIAPPFYTLHQTIPYVRQNRTVLLQLESRFCQKIRPHETATTNFELLQSNLAAYKNFEDAFLQLPFLKTNHPELLQNL